MSRAEALDGAALVELVADRRWFAAKGREPDGARVSGVAHADGDFELVFVEIGFPEGTHETYLLPLHFDGAVPHDALEFPEDVGLIAALCGVDTPGAEVRPIGVEQSNSSVVLDERYVLKVYRRLDAGPNPELELLQALGAAGFPYAPRLVGSLEHQREPLEAALALVTELVPAAGDGWELTMDALGAGDSDWLPRRARRLGEVTGAMHSALAASDDPHLAPEEPSTEAIPLLAATVDEEIERLAAEVPELAETGLASRLETVRDLVHDLGHVGPPGLVIRIHGDYHLGQVLWTESEDWIAIDFEGEPSNSLAERRRRTSALKDVAGMLRSFSYAADGAKLLRGITVSDGWEWACRAAFLDGWRETVDPRLLPMSEPGIERLLELHELQKLVYELRYELRNRPDWVVIPLSGIERLLERQ